jgi:endonuclease III
MSHLTSELMGIKKGKASKSSPPVVMSIVTRRLVRQYGTPSLGNYRDTVKEIFYILLSARTTESLYKSAHHRLFQTFPNLTAIANARNGEVLRCVRGAGLGKKRADQIVRTARRLICDFGPRPQRKIAALSAEKAYRYLCGLPGMGPKSSLCVMMYSLDFDVFPVDVNVRRIVERMGLIPKNRKHYQAQKMIPKLVPEGRAKELHIALVVHGREICLPQRPLCDKCCISEFCKMGRSRKGSNRGRLL